MGEFRDVVKNIVANTETVVFGKTGVVKTALAAVLAGGHVLLEDVPGVAKTVLVRSLAISSGCSFRRIQCTPDLLPSDVTGVSIFNPQTREFEFRPGPIFSQMLVADEINRATPRTQSALLEAMAESQVSVDGLTHKMAEPFIVFATQNPVEHEGTFPLPEAQLDRFMLKVHIGYPSKEEEQQIIRRHLDESINREQVPVAETSDILRARELMKLIYIDPAIENYILDIVFAECDVDSRFGKLFYAGQAATLRIRIEAPAQMHVDQRVGNEVDA